MNSTPILIVFMSLSYITVNCSQVQLHVQDSKDTYLLDKWKLKESNTLYESYRLQKKVKRRRNEPFTKVYVNPGIDRQDLCLFDEALNYLPTTDEDEKSFAHYYRNLSFGDQRALIIATGEYGPCESSKKLNAKRLTVQLLMACFNKEFISNNIVTKLIPEIRSSRSFLVTNFIKDAVALNALVTSPPCFFAIEGKGGLEFDSDHRLHALPRMRHISFKGVPKAFRDIYEGKVCAYRYLIRKGSTHYCIADGTPDDENCRNAKTLWTIEFDNKKAVKSALNRVIYHTHPINCIKCSKDGRYVVSNSKGQLIITDLYVPEGNDSADTVLIADNNPYYHVAFNNAGTVVAAINIDMSKAAGKVTLWDIEKKAIIEPSFTLGNTYPTKLFFSDDDSRLVMVSEGTLGGLPTISLWNTSTREQLVSISIARERREHLISFVDNKVFIPTQNKLFVIDHQTGEIINIIVHTEDQTSDYAVIIPMIPTYDKTLLFLGMKRKDTSSCIKILDTQTERCIATIEQSENNLNHLGISHDRQQLVATFANYMMASTQLYNDEQRASLAHFNNASILYHYLLWRHIASKKAGEKSLFHQSLLDYLECGITDENSKKLIQKYIL